MQVNSLTQNEKLQGVVAQVRRFVDDPLGVRRMFRPNLRFGPDEV